jgi:hypothetical protein
MATRIGSLLLALGAAGLLVALPPHPAWAVTFTVNDRDDLPDLRPGDGQCHTGAGTCTLRAAINEANALGGTHAIVLPAGTYKLKIHEALGIGRVTLMILGVGATRPVIDGNRIARVFFVHQGATVSGATCHLAHSLSTVDPKLGSLKLNGGFTKTHALRPGSPAIDAGSNDRCPATDQRGVGRPRDGNGDGAAICDIGAYEASTSP